LPEFIRDYPETVKPEPTFVVRQAFATEAIGITLGIALAPLDFKTNLVRIIPSNQESLLLAAQLGFQT
jgi:hypothetical protein